MIIGYLTIKVTKEQYHWAVHSYGGPVGEKAITALPGLCFTSCGYMSRKHQQDLYKEAELILAPKEEAKLPSTNHIEELLHVSPVERYQTNSLAIAGHEFKVEPELSIPELITPTKLYSMAQKGTRESYPGYREVLVEVVTHLRKNYPTEEEDEEKVYLISNNKLKKFDEIPGVIIVDGSLVENNTPGYSEAEIMARTVTNSNETTVENEYTGKPTTLVNFWKPLLERNPLLYQRYLIHDSIQSRKYYTTFDDKTIADFGKRASTVSYAIVAPAKRDPILDRLMEVEIQPKLEPTTHYIVMGNVYKPVVNASIGRHGTSILLDKEHERQYSDEVTVCGTYPSPGLSQRGHEYHKNLEKIFLRYLDGDVKEDLEVLDITDAFYNFNDGKRTIKPGIEKDGGLVKVPSPGAHKGFQFLILGKDLPHRNALNRLTGDVKIELYSSLDINLVRYGVIITSAEGSAIYSYYNCNVRFVQLGGQ